MSKTMKRISTISFVLIVFPVVAWWQVSYPRVWNDIHLGMTRQEVYDRIGPPGQDWGDLKGAFWTEVKLTGWQELWIYFDKDKVAMLRINRYFGTDSTFYIQNVRYEHDKAQ